MPLFLILCSFLLLQLLLPLQTAVKIGEDEDFELSKAVLALKGYTFYTEIWNDQPLLHTVILKAVLAEISNSVLAARLLTSIYTLLLLGSVLALGVRVGPWASGAISAILLLFSPGFLELGSSCMLEIPALAPAVAGLLVLFLPRAGTVWCLSAAGLAGFFFAVACQTKFISLVLLPLVAAILILRHCQEVLGHNGPNVSMLGVRGMIRSCAPGVLVFSLAFLAAFGVLQLVLCGQNGWLQLEQSWASHFGKAKTFEYGSAEDYPFQWIVLARHWDTTIPAIIGLCTTIAGWRRCPLRLLPPIWLGLALVVFGTHTPWWPYYYVHLAIPLAWCAAIGWGELWARSKRLGWKTIQGVSVGIFFLMAVCWIAGRVYFQVQGIRRMPQTYSSLAIAEIDRFKPHVRFMYTDEPSFSFHTGIPMPPKLAVGAAKRFWSGNLSHALVRAEVTSTMPELLLLRNEAQAVPFEDLMNAQYRMVYQDKRQRLYALKTIISKARE